MAPILFTNFYLRVFVGNGLTYERAANGFRLKIDTFRARLIISGTKYRNREIKEAVSLRQRNLLIRDRRR